MTLAIVAYPSLDTLDLDWIEAFRAQHDPQASRIAVHFTLVFPFDGTPGELRREISMVTNSVQPIPFTIRRTAVVHDVMGTDMRLLLVPDEGAAQIATLHDRLYAGTLRGHLNPDIPFMPHMTVGAARESKSVQALAAALGLPPRTIRGTLSTLELIDVRRSRVRTIATFDLGATS